MHDTNEAKTQTQRKTAAEVFKNKRVIATWATASGKTNVGIFFTDELLRKNPDAKILLLVGERAHKQNWKDEFVKFLGEDRTKEIYSNLTVECYASLHKYADTQWDAIIMDECHHVFSDTRIGVLHTMKAEYVLALSATLKKDHIAEFEYIFGKFHLSKISLQKSIDNGYIAEPTIWLHPLELSKGTYTQEITMYKGFKAKRVKKTCRWEERFMYMGNKALPNLELTVRCSEYQKYSYLDEQFDYAKKRSFANPGNEFVKNQWLRTGLMRKQYLGLLKTDYVRKQIKSFNDDSDKFLCFCTNIAQAETLGGKNVVSSKNSKSLKLVDKFNENEINSLFAVGMITEGVTLKDLSKEIIIQLDNVDRLFLQKAGRAMRAEHPEIHIYYYKDTRDEQFLKKALENVKQEYVKVYEDRDNRQTT